MIPPTTSIQDLPTEVMFNIFSHVTLSDASVVGSVCKAWNTITGDEVFWKIFARTGCLDPIDLQNNFDCNKSFLKYTQKYVWSLVKSLDPNFRIVSKTDDLFLAKNKINDWSQYQVPKLKLTERLYEAIETCASSQTMRIFIEAGALVTEALLTSAIRKLRPENFLDPAAEARAINNIKVLLSSTSVKLTTHHWKEAIDTTVPELVEMLIRTGHAPAEETEVLNFAAGKATITRGGILPGDTPIVYKVINKNSEIIRMLAEIMISLPPVALFSDLVRANVSPHILAGLIKHGAKPTDCDLIAAIEAGSHAYSETVGMIIKAGVSPKNIRYLDMKFDCVKAAILKCTSKEVLQLLLDAGAPLPVDALHYAGAMNAPADIWQFLRSKGATAKREMLLGALLAKPTVNTIQNYLDSGIVADQDMLHHALIVHHPFEVIQTLINGKANPTIYTKDLAIRMGASQETIDFIQSQLKSNSNEQG